MFFDEQATLLFTFFLSTYNLALPTEEAQEAYSIVPKYSIITSGSSVLY